ncbi:hypothetical protein MesoLjLb_36050 [Mesorhizobium sp. L-8-3]|nr:hypothetical protein MesoLjLb_36050 [Mesorhizobium sp. L-8-3]
MAGGGGRAISCGYWSLATHALRDLVETGQLLELFEAMPSKATEWSQTDPMKRHGAFGFSKVKGDLEKHRGKSEFWQERFSIYSNLGSHPSRESLTFNLTPRGKMVGPTFNEGRFKLWLRALAGDTMVTTRQFVRAFDATSGQAPLSVQRRFLHATVEGFHNLTEPITESDLSLYWVP